MPPYVLAKHVFACLDDEHIVLLDLKQDRYFSFAAAKTRSLAAIVYGWPKTHDAHVTDPAEGDLIARQLLERRLLSRASAADEASLPSAFPQAGIELSSDQYDESPPRRLVDTAAFLKAVVAATIVLRWGSLERAVRRVKTRRAGLQGSQIFDIKRTRELMAIFTDLRPFLFTSREACLFESLVLLEFLACYGIFPHWIFGVRARPFAAHCWVQQGDIVLNDTLGHLARYKPIMMV